MAPSNAVLAKLKNIIRRKKTNLAVSADFLKASHLIEFVEKVGPFICVLKTHIDIMVDFQPDVTRQLRSLANRYDFLIFEDRKFADIGQTVYQQFTQGIYQISNWADMINAHTLPGEGVIEGLRQGIGNRPIGLLLLAQMSSQGNLITAEYTRQTIQMAHNHRDCVIGFIGQKRLTNDDLITMTPGVKLKSAADHLKQTYNTPEFIIKHNKADIMIVGRGITHANDPANAARTYQKRGWQAYCCLFDAS